MESRAKFSVVINCWINDTWLGSEYIYDEEGNPSKAELLESLVFNINAGEEESAPSRTGATESLVVNLNADLTASDTDHESSINLEGNGSQAGDDATLTVIYSDIEGNVEASLDAGIGNSSGGNADSNGKRISILPTFNFPTVIQLLKKYIATLVDYND